jgi:hypothetical protein
MKIHLLAAALFDKDYVDVIKSVRPSQLIGVWPFWEASGGIANNQVVSSSTGNIIHNGTFEAGDDTTTFGAWQERVGTGSIDSEAGIKHGGAASCKLTRGADDNTWVYQTLRVEPGNTYNISFWTYGNGGNETRFGLKNVTNNTWIFNLGTATGYSAASWNEYTNSFAAPAGCGIVELYLMTPTGAGELAYWDDVSISGTVKLNASYGASGITLGADGFPGTGRTAVATEQGAILFGCPFFASSFDTDEGSMICAGKVDSADEWTDGLEFRYLQHHKSFDDAHKYIAFGKHTDNHKLVWRRKAGNGKNANEQTYTFAVTGTLEWFVMGYSWSISTPRLRGYLYVPGEVAWHRVFDVAGGDMDAFGTSTMTDINSVVGAGALLGTPAQDWIGSIAYAAIWAGDILTEGEMQRAMGA